ncbi:unnamed protein product [Penicillium pancosmium]
MDANRVKPSIHFTGGCWINDPCAPGYDPTTQLYHVFYQCNPHSTNWGNISWGHATSKDLIYWAPFSSPALLPDEAYDKDGVFTGCMAPPSISPRLEGHISIIYSSVCALPFHWSTPPYPRHAAGLAIAESSDGGATWSKSINNPILLGEPEGVNVTGFRDPFLAEWPAMDFLYKQKSLYGLISGGIEGEGPTTFLYSVQPNNLCKWSFIGPLVNLPNRFQPSPKWSGNFGVNWECVNFLTLGSGADSRTCLIIGAEGDVERDHIKLSQSGSSIPPRTIRSLLWMFGDLKSNNTPSVDYTHGGYLDCGSLYAANSFFDKQSGRYIMHAWIPEEDIPAGYAKEKGWNGALAIPRELFLFKIENATRSLRSSLAEIASIDSIQQSNGLMTICTLGFRPIRELSRLQNRYIHTHEWKDMSLSLTTLKLCSTVFPSWELQGVISVDPDNCQEVGFYIRHNRDMSIYTKVAFSLHNETIRVDREKSNPDHSIRNCPEEGPFTLFYQKNPSAAEEHEILEDLHIRVISDGDILEVYANDRFALTTLVYSPDYTTPMSISISASGDPKSVLVKELRIWDGLPGPK